MLINYGILQAILLLAMVYFFGVIKTILGLIILFRIIIKVIDTFGYQFAVGQDIIHFFDSEKAIPNLVGYMEIKKIDFFQLASVNLYKKGIMNIRKLRQIPVNIFGFFLWKDIDSDQAIKQVSKIDDSFESENDVIAYCNKWAHEKIPYTRPQWEIKLIENYSEETSLLFIKCHHSLTDGMGILTLFAFLNDDSFCPKSIPDIKMPTLLQKTMAYLYVPIALVVQFAVTIFYEKKKQNLIFHTPDQKNSGESVFYATKTYNFEELRKCYKKFDKVTFNHFIMGIVGKSMNEWYAKNGVHNPGDMIMSCPVNMKIFPKRIEDINLNNGTSVVTIQVPVVKDLKDAVYKSKKRFNKYFNLPTLIAALDLQAFFSYVPPGIGKLCYAKFVDRIDMVLSNVAGSREPLFLCNKEIKSITVFLGLFANVNMNIVINSYNGNLRVQMTADKHIQMNPKEFIDLIEQNIDSNILESKID